MGRHRRLFSPEFKRDAVEAKSGYYGRDHLKGWLAWMIDQRHYAARTVALRLSTVEAFLTSCSAEGITLVTLSQVAKALRSPACARKPSALQPSIACPIVKPKAEARRAIFSWIVWYNSTRLHTSIGNRPPIEYERHLQEAALAA